MNKRGHGSVKENKTSRITLGFEPFVAQAAESLARALGITTSELIRDAVIRFLEGSAIPRSFEERALTVLDSPYGRAKTGAEPGIAEASGKGPVPRYTARISVAFPGSVYERLCEVCHQQQKGVTSQIRQCVDLYLSDAIFKDYNLAKI
jgi:hypothetical protein